MKLALLLCVYISSQLRKSSLLICWNQSHQNLQSLLEKKWKQPTKTWEGKLWEQNWLVVVRRGKWCAQFVPNKQASRSGRGFLTNILVWSCHLRKISVPSFCGCFKKSWNWSPSSWRCFVLPWTRSLSNYRTQEELQTSNTKVVATFVLNLNRVSSLQNWRISIVVVVKSTKQWKLGTVRGRIKGDYSGQKMKVGKPVHFIM